MIMWRHPAQAYSNGTNLFSSIHVQVLIQHAQQKSKDERLRSFPRVLNPKSPIRIFDIAYFAILDLDLGSIEGSQRDNK